MTDIPSHIARVKQGSEAYLRLLNQENEAMFAEARQHYEDTKHYIQQLQDAADAHVAGIHERFLKNPNPSDVVLPQKLTDTIDREIKNITRQ